MAHLGHVWMQVGFNMRSMVSWARDKPNVRNTTEHDPPIKVKQRWKLIAVKTHVFSVSHWFCKFTLVRPSSGPGCPQRGPSWSQLVFGCHWSCWAVSPNRPRWAQVEAMLSIQWRNLEPFGGSFAPSWVIIGNIAQRAASWLPQKHGKYQWNTFFELAMSCGTQVATLRHVGSKLGSWAFVAATYRVGIGNLGDVVAIRKNRKLPQPETSFWRWVGPENEPPTASSTSEQRIARIDRLRS